MFFFLLIKNSDFGLIYFEGHDNLQLNYTFKNKLIQFMKL